MKTAFVIVFYLLQQGPPDYIARMPNVTFSAYPRWERVEFPYFAFTDSVECDKAIHRLNARPPAGVASIIVCERQR